MKQYIILEVETSREVPELAEKIAGRAWTLSGVENARVVAHSGEAMPLIVAMLRDMGHA